MNERKTDGVIVMGCDLYNGTLTGDKAATVGANSGLSANHAGPAVIIPETVAFGSGGDAVLVVKNVTASPPPTHQKGKGAGPSRTTRRTAG